MMTDREAEREREKRVTKVYYGKEELLRRLHRQLRQAEPADYSIAFVERQRRTKDTVVDVVDLESPYSWLDIQLELDPRVDES